MNTAKRKQKRPPQWQRFFDAAADWNTTKRRLLATFDQHGIGIDRRLTPRRIALLAGVPPERIADIGREELELYVDAYVLRKAAERDEQKRQAATTAAELLSALGLTQAERDEAREANVVMAKAKSNLANENAKLREQIAVYKAFNNHRKGTKGGA